MWKKINNYLYLLFLYHEYELKGVNNIKFFNDGILF